MSYEFTTQRQFQVAQLLQSTLLVVGVVSLGVGLGHFMALSVVSETACGAAISTHDICTPIINELNSGLAWGLGGGMVAIVTSALMNYALARIEL